MTVLRVTVPDQYFCTKHPDLNITAREKKIKQGQVSLLMEKYSPLQSGCDGCDKYEVCPFVTVSTMIFATLRVPTDIQDSVNGN